MSYSDNPGTEPAVYGRMSARGVVLLGRGHSRLFGGIALLLRIAIVFALLQPTLFAQDDFIIPIQASSPHVFMALTDEKDRDEGVFTSEPRAPSQGNFLPFDRPTNYEVAVYDTGSPATIMGRTEFENYDIAGAKLSGTEVTPVGGVGETVNAINSDPLGVYVTGFDSLLTNPRTGEQTIDKSRLSGSITNSVLYADFGVELPNLIGTNTSTFYTSVMTYGDPRILEYEGEIYRSPNVTLHELGTLPRPDRRIGLTLEPGAFGAPAFLINLGGIGIGGNNDLRDNPSAPTVAGSFFVGADITNNGVSRSTSAILDTGAQGSIVSEQLAAELGFDVINDDPDFVVRIAGVTGQSEEVPGFYADEFFLPGTDGGLKLTNVPLIVFNLTDPRDGANTLPALIGMNVFATRDVTLNPEAGNAYLGVSDPAQIRHNWSSSTATAAWTAAENWEQPGVPAIDWYADVTNTSGSPQVVTINEDSTVSMLVTSGNPDMPNGTMSINIESGRKLQLFGSAIVQEGSTIHLENSELDPLAVELRGGTLSGSGTVGGEVLSQGTLLPGGVGEVGTLAFSGSVDQLTKGKLVVELGDNSNRENLQFDRLEVGGNFGINGALEILTLDAYQPAAGDRDVFLLVAAEGDALGEFDSYLFNGVELESEFLVSSDRRAIRDHVGSGQFVTISYPNEGVELVNYTALTGDTDGDGSVTFDDFLVLALNYGQEADWVGGDFDDNLVVDFPDFLALSANFGAEAASARLISAVPEPSAWCLSALGYVAGLAMRRRRPNEHPQDLLPT